MYRLTEDERLLISSALDTHRTVIAGACAMVKMGPQAVQASKNLMNKLQGMDLIMYPASAPRLTKKAIGQLKRLLPLNDDCEVDDDVLLSVSDEGVFVNSWLWLRRDDMPAAAQKEIWGEVKSEEAK